MEMSRAAIGVLAAACISAGAGGAYFASRDAGPAPTVQSELSTAPASDAAPAATDSEREATQ